MASAYRVATRVLSAVLLVVGCAMAAATLAAGGGALARGVILGVLLTALGAGRLYLATRPRARGERP